MGTLSVMSNIKRHMKAGMTAAQAAEVEEILSRHEQRVQECLEAGDFDTAALYAKVGQDKVLALAATW